MSQRILYPLTSPQLSIWYTEQMFPGTSISNVAGTLRIQENVDFNLLEKAIQLFIKNNDGMRLRFCLDENGNPQQYFADYVEKKIPFIDFSIYEDPDTAFFDWNNLVTLKPFEVLDKELYSFTMVKTSNCDGGFYLITHHLISDAWNMILLGDTIKDYYLKLKKGITNENEYPPKPSYLSYIKNELSYKESNRYEKDKIFWGQVFDSVPEEVTVLKAKKTNLMKTKSKRKSFLVPKKFTNKLKEYCTEYKVTPYPLFLSALAMYIGRVTDKKEIVLGTPLLNRLSYSEKNTFGMFINTIPLRLELINDESFHALSERVLGICSEVYRHQRFPYDQIMKIVREKHDIKENLYDIVLSYQNNKLHKSDSIDYMSRWHFNGYQSNSLTIHINDRDDTGTMIINYDYHEDLYYDKEIEFLHQHLVTLFWHALDNPHKAICKIDMLTENEKRKVLYDFNKTEMNYPREKLIHQLFEEQVERTPNNVAIVFGDKTMTYRELNEKANQLAHVLRSKGIKRDDIVGIMVTRSFELIISIMAILKAGGAFMTIEPDFPKDRIKYMLEFSKTKIIISQKDLYNYEEYRTEFIDILESFDKKENEYNLMLVNNSADLAYIIFTSGTSGYPKGVMVEHKSLCNFVYNIWEEFNYDETTNVLSIASVCFDVFILEVMPSLLSGSKLVLSTKNEQLLPHCLSQLIIKNDVTTILTTPALIKLLINDNEYRNCLEGVKYIMSGGEPFENKLLLEVKNLTNAKVINAYGPTEATIATTFKTLKTQEKITIGKPIHNTKIFILDDYLNAVPIGVMGEIYISGEGVARGYVNNEEMSEKAFIMNPYSGTGKIYKTGDIARWYPRGEIEFIGRKDKQVKIRGYRIELSEIENTILGYDHIKDVAVTIQKDDLYGEYLRAFYVSNYIIEPSKLLGYLKQKLPNYMIPKFINQVDSIPMNSNGKRDINKLSSIECIRNSSNYYVPPSNEVEKRMMDILCDLLKIERLSVEADIFEQGVDSLTVIQLIAFLNREGFNIAIEDVYRNPSIKKLYNYVNQGENSPNQNSYELKEIKENITEMILSGKLPRLDSAALNYIPYNSILSFTERKPVLYSYMKTIFGNIGVYILPLSAKELFGNKELLLQLCSSAIKKAKLLGAKVISLTGLLPAVTNHGEDIIKSENHNVKITTGYATLAATMILSLKKSLNVFERDIIHENIVILGIEGIGAATTELLLSEYEGIKKVSLCDISNKNYLMVNLKNKIHQNYACDVQCFRQ